MNSIAASAAVSATALATQVSQAAAQTVVSTGALSEAALSVPPPEDHFVSVPIAAPMPTPPSEHAGWKATMFGPVLLSPIAVMVVGGGLVMAKVFRRPLSQLLVTILGTILAFDEAFIGGHWLHAAEVYLSGVATLRMMQHGNIQPLGQAKRKEIYARDVLNIERLPTLKDLYGRNRCYTDAVNHLTGLLRRYPEAQQFFHFDPDRQNLLEEIGWVRVADTAVDALGIKTDSTGAFSPEDGILYGRNIVEVALHELCHALHFSATRRRITFPDLQRILKYFENGGEILPRHAVFLESVRNFMQDKERSPRYIPEEVRHAAAILAFQIGSSEYKWNLESVPSFLQWRLDRSVRHPKYLILGTINKYILWVFMPMAWLGGVLKTTAELDSTFAYDNPWILRRVLKLGPIDSLLGPKSK